MTDKKNKLSIMDEDYIKIKNKVLECKFNGTGCNDTILKIISETNKKISSKYTPRLNNMTNSFTTYLPIGGNTFYSVDGFYSKNLD